MSASFEVSFANNESNDESEDEQNDAKNDPAFGVFPAHVALQLDGSRPKLRSTVQQEREVGVRSSCV